MSVPDPNWFYSAIAQSAAAIVGVICAFVASWVMMMASERSQIEKRINEIDTEIKELKRQNVPLLEYIEEVDRKDDEESVDNFLISKKPELDLENLPTCDKMRKELLEGGGIGILDEKFDSTLEEKYNDLIEMIRQEKEEAVKFEKEELAPSKSISIFSRLFAKSLPDLTDLKNSIIIQPIANKHKYDYYKDCQKIIEKNNKEISYKKAKIQELQRQLSQIVLPEHFKGLIFYLIYFTIVVVILPLWLLPITSEQHLFWKPIVLGLFITGLFSAFLYIFIEIKHATKKTKQCLDGRLKLLVRRLAGWFTTHITPQKIRDTR
uniref:Uncharacterized protein n=1 Tax=Candidatus Methanogaster sp. ANME-2c ERB4 TaxID=2759911 RepID=A0A7G9YGJ4_9EURY|nr:hypothetical protein ANPEMHCN_00007 [Methanosarcinales archaeon ANME-2c ERB4]